MGVGDEPKKLKDDGKKELKCSPMIKEQIVNSSYFKRNLAAQGGTLM
jgi:citrate lyase alpha subunit